MSSVQRKRSINIFGQFESVESEALAYVCIFIGAKLMLGSNPTTFEINWNFSLD